jgi:hypothetical protein
MTAERLSPLHKALILAKQHQKKQEIERAKAIVSQEARRNGQPRNGATRLFSQALSPIGRTLRGFHEPLFVFRR